MCTVVNFKNLKWYTWRNFWRACWGWKWKVEISIITWAVILMVFNHWSHHITQVKQHQQYKKQCIDQSCHMCMIFQNFSTLSWHKKFQCYHKKEINHNFLLSINLGHGEDVNNAPNLYWNHSVAPSLALNIFDLISTIIKV